MQYKQLIYILKIATLTLLISFFLDKLVFFSLNKVSDKVLSGQGIGKLNQFLTVKDSVKLIVIGNSRANHHIDVNSFQTSAYNMGIDGTGIAFISTALKTLPKAKQQFLIIHIDTKDFFDTTYDGSDINTLKTKFKRNPSITNSLIASGQTSLLQYYYYSLNYNNKIISILKNYFKPSYNFKNYHGFDPLILNDDQKEMRNKILSNPTIKNCTTQNEINPIALNYLKEIQKISYNPNKNILFITSPIYHDYCNEDNIKLKILMEKLELKYLDFTNLFKETNNNNLWKDETHLSDLGAEKFTQHLLKFINLN